MRRWIEPDALDALHRAERNPAECHTPCAHVLSRAFVVRADRCAAGRFARRLGPQILNHRALRRRRSPRVDYQGTSFYRPAKSNGPAEAGPFCRCRCVPGSLLGDGSADRFGEIRVVVGGRLAAGREWPDVGAGLRRTRAVLVVAAGHLVVLAVDFALD